MYLVTFFTFTLILKYNSNLKHNFWFDHSLHFHSTALNPSGSIESYMILFYKSINAPLNNCFTMIQPCTHWHVLKPPTPVLPDSDLVPLSVESSCLVCWPLPGLSGTKTLRHHCHLCLWSATGVPESSTHFREIPPQPSRTLNVPKYLLLTMSLTCIVIVYCKTCC